MNEALKRLYPVQAFYLSGVYLFSSLLLLWFYKLGLSFGQMIAYYIILYLIGMATIALVRKIRSKPFMAIGILFQMVIVSIYVFGFRKEYLPLVGILTGPIFLFFWVSYNVQFFGNIDNKKRAFSSAMYNFAFCFLSTFMPLAAGFIAFKFGMHYVFVISFVLLATALLLALRTANTKFAYKLMDALHCAKGVRRLIFLEGFWEHTTFIAIPLISIFFIKDELHLGAYLAYLGLIGAIASLVMAKVSDRLKKRGTFLYPLAFIVAALTFSLVFARSILPWVVLTGLLYLANPALKPFQTAVALDNAKCNTQSLMIAREFMLNFGRMTGTVSFAIFMFFGMKEMTFALAAVAMLAYLFVIRMKGYYRN